MSEKIQKHNIIQYFHKPTDIAIPIYLKYTINLYYIALILMKYVGMYILLY